MKDKRVMKFVSFLDENDNKIEGWFKVIEDNGIFIKFITSTNILTIPYSRILKIKEKEGENVE